LASETVEILFLLLLGLFLITLIGHGIWVFFAMVFRALLGIERREPASAEECGRCGRLRPPSTRFCPACRLDSQGILAVELNDLRVTLRQLQRLRKQDGIEPDLHDRLLSVLSARRDTLLGKRVERPQPAPVAEPDEHILTVLPADDVPAPVAAVPEVPAWRRLEGLLAACASLSDMPVSQRDLALSWYRQSSETELALLGVTAQRWLARLLKLAGLADDALRGYRRLLACYPNDGAFAETALDAGRFALGVEERAEAGRLFEMARDRAESAELRREAEQLLARLAPATEIMPAEPVAPPATEPVAQPRLWAEPAAVAPVPVPEPAAPVAAVVAPPRPPRRSFLELLSAFMEQSNILWGELVGGLLIVICSIALVISLWPKLEENPAYEFMIFVSVTAMLFGAGLYTLHHWKLEATSRGLLIIAALLVPLNFFAIASQMKGSSGPLELVLEFGSLAIFGALLFFTGRVLLPEGGIWFTLATLGASAAQLLVPRVLTDAPAGSPLALFLLGCVPAACHLVGCAGGAYRTYRAGPLTSARAGSLFVLFGTSTFAMCTALGLLVYWNISRGAALPLTMANLALLIAFIALPLLGGGVLIQRRLTEETAETQAPEAGTFVVHGGVLRTGATATALTGMLVMLAAVALAWQVPKAVLMVTLLDFAVLSYLAFRQKMPYAHGAALPCLALAWLTAFHRFTGVPIADAIFSMGSGTALLPLVLIWAGLSEWFFRRKWEPHAQFYGIAGGVAAIASILLVTLPTRGIDLVLGPGGEYAHPATALFVYAIYGGALLVANARWRRPVLTSIGLALLVAASLWGLWCADLDREFQRVPLWSAVLGVEALLLGTIACLTWRRGESPPVWSTVYAEPMARTAEGLAPLALLAAIWSGVQTLIPIVMIAFGTGPVPMLKALLTFPWSFEYTIALGCLFLLFTILAAVEQRAVLARISGLLLIATVIPAAGWWAGQLGSPEQKLGLMGLAIALAGTALAGVVVVSSSLVREGARPWHAVLAAWRGPAATAAILAIVAKLLVLPLGPTVLASWAGGLIVVTVLMLAWAYDRATFAWIASFLALGSLGHEFARHLALPTPWPHISLLAHASLALVAGLGLKRWLAQVPGRSEGALGVRLHRVFVQPLLQSSLLTSVLALSVVFFVTWPTVQVTSWCLCWLAAIWFVHGCLERRVDLFAGFQWVLTLAVIGLTASWLHGREWFLDHPWGSTGRLLDPWSLQVFGIALGLLALAWRAVRIGLRDRPEAQRLLEPGFPTADRLMLPVIVLGQLCLAVAHLQPSLLNELNLGLRVPDSLSAHAFGGGAWALLALLAAVLIAGLWERLAWTAVLGMVVVALSVPVLIAGPFEANYAAPLALRWGLGVCFLAIAIPVWRREQLAAWTQRWKCRLDADNGLAPLVRGLSVVGTVVPILAMTCILSVLPFFGVTPLAPAHDSFFHSIGATTANVVPLLLVALTLFGYALRERSAGYAFSTSLVINLSVLLGHAIGFLTQHAPLDASLSTQLTVQLLQLAAIAAAACTIGWIEIRARWLPDTPAPALLRVQLGLGAMACTVFLGIALGSLVAVTPPTLPIWTAESGSFFGWVGLVSCLGAARLFLHRQREKLRPIAAGLPGIALLGLLACSVAGAEPAWGYRTLMLGWAGYALACVLAGWQISERRRQDGEENGTPEWIDGVSTWVAIASIATVLLGVKAAIAHADHLWAATAIALACPAAALVAVWRRQEAWAFAAGLGINLAASLVVWHYHDQLTLEAWWVLLLQINTLACAATAALWLGLRQRLYGQTEVRVEGGPLLTLQVMLGVVGNLVLLAVPALVLFFVPHERLRESIARTGDVWGWLAFVGAVAVAGWHAWQSGIAERLSGAGVLLLGSGILTACLASRYDTGDWHAYHVLLGFWMVAGFAALLEPRALRLAFNRTPEGEVTPGAASPRGHLAGWVIAIGVLTMLFAVRGTWEDPARPYWSAGAALAVCGMMAGLALQTRAPASVTAAGFCLNIAATIAWVAWGGSSFEYLLQTQALCFGLAAAAWSLAAGVLKSQTEENSFKLSWPALVQPFTHLASLIGLCILAGLTLVSANWVLLQVREPVGGWLPWATLMAVVAPFALRLWEDKAWFAREGLYVLGLAGLGMLLNAAGMTPHDYCWNAALMLSPYFALVAFVAWKFARDPQLAASLSIRSADRLKAGWFVPAQFSVALIAGALSVWMALDGSNSFSARLAGPLVCGTLVAGFVLLADWGRSLRALALPAESSSPGLPPAPQFIPFGEVALRYVALAFGTLTAVEIGWAWLDPSAHAPDWLMLHRTVLLMVSLAFMTVVYGVSLARRLPPGGWAESCRRAGPVVGALALLALIAVLGQEAWLYTGETIGAPMARPAIIVVLFALIGLMVSGLTFAVAPGRDPLGLSERGRTAYVYAAELVLVLMFLHLRLTMPELFHRGIMARYWPFILMGIAFCGAAVADFFQRRGLRVLAEPLERSGIFLPLLPMLAFWAAPGGSYAVIWFAAGLLYGMLSIRKQSFRFALLAALAANVGLWVLLYHGGIAFLAHPQLWLIPVAVIVLVSEFYNRERLSAQQSATLRYLGLIVIYVSSSADMFITGVGESALYPVILAVLSVAGILTGMLMRIRAFLLLGFSFLMLVLMSIIWYAGVDRGQTWILWSAGIALGMAILVLFGIFEKRRNDVLQVIENMKRWR
jgi:hypothetical protein